MREGSPVWDAGSARIDVALHIGGLSESKQAGSALDSKRPTVLRYWALAHPDVEEFTNYPTTPTQPSCFLDSYPCKWL